MVAWLQRISREPTVSLKRFILAFHVWTTYRFNGDFVPRWQSTLIWWMPYHPNSPGNLILFSQCSQNSLKLIWAASLLSPTETQHNKPVEKGHLWDHLFPNFSLLSMATLSFAPKSWLHSSWLGETLKGGKKKTEKDPNAVTIYENQHCPLLKHINSGCHLISLTCFTMVTKHG